MQHSVAPWPSLIRSVRKVRPPFHCLLSLKTTSENHFCYQQVRCRIDSLRAITVLSEPPWWAIVSSWISSLGQRHASQTKADFAQENRCPSDCWIVLPFCSQLCIFFSFVTIPLEKWLHAKQPCTCPCNCYLSVFWTMQVFFRLQLWIFYFPWKMPYLCVSKTRKKIHRCVHAFYNTCYSICQIELRPSLARMGARKSLVNHIIFKMDRGGYRANSTQFGLVR